MSPTVATDFDERLQLIRAIRRDADRIDGSRLAEQQGVKLPADDEAGLRKAMHCGENTGSLARYLEAFDITLSVMQTEESLYRSAYELAQDAAAENVRYMEVRYSPMLHVRKGLRLVKTESVFRDSATPYGLEEVTTDDVIRCFLKHYRMVMDAEQAS